MHISGLTTPSFLLDMSVLETNIGEMAALCRANGVALWPMVKTHKSCDIARLQRAAGAAGFLAGTLAEAEELVRQGFNDIMLAYPVAGRENIARVTELARQARVIIGLDGAEAAGQLAEALGKAGLMLEYLLIIDCGLHRFGVPPAQAPALARQLAGLAPLKLRGIATHPGQAYAATGWAEVAKVAEEELAALVQARDALRQQGFAVDMVATGSTPTAQLVVNRGVVNVLRPGNYVFYDNIQVALGVTGFNRCALTVLATIVAQPRPDTFLIDAGSKCLGLDKGAHGNTLVTGYGYVKHHPEALVASLSEEVGKLQITGATTLRVGDTVEIIPNHACSAANMTSFLLGHRDGRLEKTVAVDMRNGIRVQAI